MSFVCRNGASAGPVRDSCYDYETLHRGQFTFETHLNYVGKGTRNFEGPVAPFQDQLHMTFELTGGLTDYASLGFMQLNGRRVGNALEYAGWRVLPHFYVPRSWHWPVDVGLVAEFSFQKTTYEENSRRVELRPVLEKTFDVFRSTSIQYSSALCTDLGPATVGTSNLPHESVTEYPSGLLRASNITAGGPLPSFLPRSEQIHQILPGGDVKLAKNLVWSFGVGVNTTSAGNRVVYKSRFEFSFGGPKGSL